MFLDYGSDDYVINPKYKSWELGKFSQQSKMTVNFENAGKKIINSNEVILEKINKIE